ncbi:MAG: hypothetical protein ATN31_11385 [Candidatus Epulonipiscioides saccharophilum]|nr:MAG: hypothetical protein ATN31_11385 [Epulopiscium sp. AS2M-Bin001]
MNDFILRTLMLFGVAQSIVGTAPIETKIYNLTEFSSFQIDDNIDVTVNIGDEYLVEVTTNADIFNYLDISVEDDTLIYTEKDNINIKDTDIKMHITCPKISGIDISDDVNMTILDTIECSDLNMDISSDATLLVNDIKADNGFIDISTDAIFIIENMNIGELSIELSTEAQLIADNINVDDLSIELSTDAQLTANNINVDDLSIELSTDAQLTANTNVSDTLRAITTTDAILTLSGSAQDLHLDASLGSKALMSKLIVNEADLILGTGATAEINATENIYLDDSSDSKLKIYSGNLIDNTEYYNPTKIEYFK